MQNLLNVKKSDKTFYSKRRLPDSNRGIKALQASALPLGQVAKNQKQDNPDVLILPNKYFFASHLYN